MQNSAAASSKVMAIARLQLFKLNGNALPFAWLNWPGATGARGDRLAHMAHHKRQWLRTLRIRSVQRDLFKVLLMTARVVAK